MENDKVAEEIAERYMYMFVLHIAEIWSNCCINYVTSFRGCSEVWDNLGMDDVICYWKKLLLEYVNITKWTVTSVAESNYVTIL